MTDLQNMRDYLVANYNELDTDANGNLSLAEVTTPGHPYAVEFNQLDTNSNGLVTQGGIDHGAGDAEFRGFCPACSCDVRWL